MSQNTEKAVKLLKSAIALLGGETEGAPASQIEIPSAKVLKGWKLKQKETLAKAIGLSFDGEDELNSLLATVVLVNGRDEDTKLDPKALTALCAALGIQPNKKAKIMAEAIGEYLQNPDPGEDSDDSEEEDDEDGDADEKPAKGKKVKKPASSDDDDDDDEESEDDDSDDEDEESEGEEVSEKDQAKRLKLHNAAAKKLGKKPASDYAALEKRMTNDDGDVVAWGEAYAKDGDGMCCGLPLQVEDEDEGIGECSITGKKFKPNKKGTALVEVKDEESDDDDEDEDSEESDDDEDEEEAPKKGKGKVVKGKKPAPSDDDDDDDDDEDSDDDSDDDDDE